jgi:hypothetical protein
VLIQTHDLRLPSLLLIVSGIGGALALSSFLLWNTAPGDILVYREPPPALLQRSPNFSPEHRKVAAMLQEKEALLPFESAAPELPPPPLPLPAEVRIAVPFSPQAPFADWGMPYQEACEETSLLMVDAYYRQLPFSREDADRAIQELVAWEMEHFGYHEDTTLEEVARIAREYLHYRTRILENPSLEDIQRELAQGRPVIVPVAGRDLGNRYFTPPGPWYHMLVITGYDGTHFLTNDPGTRRGEAYQYRYDVLLEAIHDWTGVKEEIRTGRKAALILEP